MEKKKKKFWKEKTLCHVGGGFKFGKKDGGFFGLKLNIPSQNKPSMSKKGLEKEI